MKKLSPFTIELEDGRLIHKPSFLFCGDCRICALNFLVCEDDEYCLGNIHWEEKPCCWKCQRLMDCLEWQSSWAGGYVKDTFNCTWEEFLEAVKMLRG